MSEEKKQEKTALETAPAPAENPESETREFEENPYQTDNRKPEDIVRLFYVHNVPIIPVVSKRGLLIGILKKEDVVAELSDIERAEKLKIDEFITRLARKMTLDDLLAYGKIREFAVINIFGDLQGRWSRLQLFNASEGGGKKETGETEKEVDAQREEQVLEWIIYLILEHIPRVLYAINEKGKTIFYNSLFEDLYTDLKQEEVETEKVEKIFGDPEDNELFSIPGTDTVYFHNRSLGIYYEKVPLLSSGKKVGFLIFCDKDGTAPIKESGMQKGLDMSGGSLSDTLAGVERQLIVDALKAAGNQADAAKSLKLTKQALTSRIKKYNISTKNIT